MAILIPSSKIYNIENPKIQNNVLEEIKVGLRKATIAMKVIPVLCGSSYKNKGVQNLLDAICAYLPAPIDVDHIKGTNPKGEEEERKTSDDEPFSGLAFKIAADPFVGKLAFFRSYSGKIGRARVGKEC
jgi:elongation factor G